MSLKRCGLYLVIVVAQVAWAGRSKQDEVGRCGLTGVYKMRQSVLQSPLYPENYPPSGCWDYVVRSPYRCPTKFHIQFLEFFLESSSNCTNDYLAVGWERDGEDLDLLCGQIAGIKKYHTPDGDLRLRFHSDDAPWTTEKGFKLLVTRLACEREDVESTNFEEVNDNSDRFHTLPLELQLPNNNYSGPFRNSISHAQYETPVRPDLQNLDVPHSNLPGLQESNLPVAHISSPFPELHHEYFNEQFSNKDGFLQQQQHLALVRTANREVGGGEWYGSRLPTSILEPCCAESFRQKHFYLSSPGFPRTAFTSLLPVSQRDCQFHLEKTSPSVCRLRIEFKFFDFGQTSNSNGENQGDLETTQETTQDVCTEDYLEIDGERFCGCRSGHVFAAVWGLGMKILRLRMGYSGIASSGFLLDVVQEVCSITQLEHQPGQMVASQPYGLIQLGNQQPVSHLYETQQNFPFLFPQRPLVYPEQQQQPIWTPEHVPHLPPTQPNYRFPQFRRTKRLSVANDAQPVAQVKTNTQRKEHYFVDGDAVYTGTAPQETQLQRRRYKKREAGEGVGNTRFYPGIFFREKDRCRFETSEILRLSVDVLWLTKPTCYAAVRGWLGNFFG